MKITLEEAAKVASLARLRFPEAELEKIAGQMSDILDYVEKLNSIPDIEKVEPLTHVFALGNARREREDEVRPSLPNEAALQNAPRPEEGCYRVAKVIEGS